MERLIKHTTRLVAQHNCVIIPGLGAFLAHNVPAAYNMEGATFMPPHRALGFNPQVTVDDALLVSEYIYAGQQTYDEASVMLREDVASLRHELSTKGIVHFGEIGTFSMNVTGKITFEQSPNGFDDPYYFGFQPLVIQQLKDIEKKEIVIKRSTFKHAMATAAAIILMFFFVSPIGDSAYTPSEAAGFVTGVSTRPEQSATPPAENRCEIAPVTDTVTENIITPAYTVPEPEQTAKSEDTVEESCNVTETAKRFSIIVASTPNAQKAQLAIEELSVKAKVEYTVVEGSGRHRIAYATYDSNKEAANALTQVKEIFPDAWVLTH